MSASNRADLTMNSAHTVAQPFASHQEVPLPIRDSLLHIVQQGYRPEEVARWYLVLYRGYTGSANYRPDASPLSDVSAIVPERQASTRSHPRLSLAEEVPEPTSSSSLENIIGDAMWTTDQAAALLRTSSNYAGMFGQSQYDSLYPANYDALRINSHLAPDQTSPQARQQIHLNQSSQSFSQISPQHTSPLTPSVRGGFRQGPHNIQPMQTPLLTWDSTPEFFSSPDFPKTSRGDDSAVSSGMVPTPWFSPSDVISSTTTSQHSLTSTAFGLCSPYGQAPNPQDCINAPTTRASVGPTSNPTTTFGNRMTTSGFSALDLPIVTIATAKRRRKSRQPQPQTPQKDTKKITKPTGQSRKVSKP